MISNDGGRKLVLNFDIDPKPVHSKFVYSGILMLKSVNIGSLNVHTYRQTSAAAQNHSSPAPLPLDSRDLLTLSLLGSTRPRPTQVEVIPLSLI